jgi:hypothetical protein
MMPLNLKLFVLGVFCSLWSFVAHCQEYRALLSQPYWQRVVAINQLYAGLVLLDDSALIINKAEEIKKFAEQNSDWELSMEMDAFCTYYYTAFQNIKNNQKSRTRE